MTILKDAIKQGSIRHDRLLTVVRQFGARHSREKTLQVRGRFRLATGCLVARYGLLHRPRSGRPLYGHKFSELLHCTRLVGEKAAQQNCRGAGIGKGVMGVAFQ